MNNKLRDLFQQPFDLETYRRVILSQLLHAQRLLTSPEMLEQYDNGDQLYGLGYLTDNEGKEIGLYYTHVHSGDVRRKRVGFRKMLHPYVNNKYGAEAAIAVFDDGEHWRLSYICDLKGGVTSAKRFSYVFGDPKGQYNTPVGRLTDLAKKRLTLDELHKTFSVDALSKEFFDEYHRHYDRIIAELSRQGNTGAVFHDYVKKMMGRIVFLHFLQKKRWLNDDPEFLSKLFFLSPYKQDFLDQELEPLFFGIFNTEPDKRKQLFQQENWDLRWLEEWKRLPYLNGGLFERDEVDKMKIKLPASLFENLFKFMASYNFTIDENDPDDADIGIDPEMLGKIFESLLEDNKAKGAFYTPKEIVRYMCKESLIAYLDSKIVTNNASERHNLNNPIQESAKLSQCGDTDTKDKCVPEVRDLKQSIRDFVEQHEFPEELEPYRTTLDTALREVKICDPAIGSGAFPMGLLNELWRCREALDVIDHAALPSPLERGTAKPGGMFEVDNKRAVLKKEIIENNIYGVDIEKGAIDIARLRFWLSIVVDAEWNVNPDSGPEPLPNFDYKFMQGNSLIESFDGHDLSHIMESGSRPLPGRGARKSGWAENQTGMEFGSDEVKQNLRNWLKIYFSLTDHKEKAYYRELINSSVKNYIVQQGIGPAAETRLNAIDPSTNKDFFLWHTWFKDIFDNGGFDIVIGNPPYGAHLSMEEKEYYRLLYPETQFKIDTYSLFVLLSLKIMDSVGTTYYIIPNTLLDNYYEEKVREKILKHHSLIEICDLSDNIFQSAVVHSMIIGYGKRQKNNEKIQIKTEHVSNEPFMIPAHYFLNQPQYCISYRNYSYQNLFDKLQKNSVHLQDVLDIRQTIKTGNDKIYICTERKADNYMPILRGKDICRYGYQYSGLYVNYGKHLANPIRHDIFEQPKILIREAGAKIVATYDDDNYYIMSSLYNAILKDRSFNLKYLLALINSRLFQFIMNKLTFEKTKGAFTKARIFHYYLLPVKIAPIKVQNQFITLVDRAMENKEKDFFANIDDIENEIDNMVYQLYNLTPEEIAIIEENAQ